MFVFCHRCGQELPGETIRGFCPECGAPQIVLRSELLAGAEDGAGEPAGTTGAPPPPRPTAIRWPVALGTAALLTLGATVVFVLASTVPVLTPLGLLALVGVSSAVVPVYGRRAAPAPLNGLIGGKLGLLTGLLLVAMLAVAVGAMGLVARFRLHAMGSFDAQWSSQLQVMLDRTADQAHAQGADAEAALKELHSPEFRAAVMLAGFGMVSSVVLAVSTAAGALAGSLAGARAAVGRRSPPGGGF